MAAGGGLLGVLRHLGDGLGGGGVVLGGRGVGDGGGRHDAALEVLWWWCGRSEAVRLLLKSAALNKETNNCSFVHSSGLQWMDDI